MRHEQARDLIREIRVGTSKPFGVNLFLPSDLLPPVPEKGASSVDSVQGTLDEACSSDCAAIPCIPRTGFHG